MTEEIPGASISLGNSCTSAHGHKTDSVAPSSPGTFELGGSHCFDAFGTNC